jgi:DNA-directed RNA polymerase specialized sigma24 family protein
MLQKLPEDHRRVLIAYLEAGSMRKAADKLDAATTTYHRAFGRAKRAVTEAWSLEHFEAA